MLIQHTNCRDYMIAMYTSGALGLVSHLIFSEFNDFAIIMWYHQVDNLLI